MQSYQDSPTCCVQCSLTHPTLVHLRVFLASSIQLSMPTRSRLTLTTYSYRFRLSLKIEYSSSRVSRAEGRVSRTEGEGEEWVRGFSRLLASGIIHCHVHAGTLVVSGICQTKNRVLLSIIAFAVNNTWNKKSRNASQSINFSLSRFAVNGKAFRVPVLQ